MENYRLKFEPIWTSALGILLLVLIYEFYTDANAANFKFDGWLVGLALFPLAMGSIFLPMVFKMLTGVPAIELTQNQLVDNVAGVTINWDDVQDVRISGVSKPFLAIMLKKPGDFFAGIQNPVKRLFLRFIFLISPGDVSVNLAFVAGDNETIASVAGVYWNRFYGRYE